MSALVSEGSSDAELARLLMNADGAALIEIYQRYGRPCYSLAYRICADYRLAEDVVDEVFVALWRAPWRFDPAQGSFATWLLTMTHHKAVDVIRRQRTGRQYGQAVAKQERSPTPEAGAGNAVVAGATAGQVRAALDRLPGEQRQVLAEAYFGGRTLGEIAAVTGVPPGTVRSRLFAGVQRLRSLLTEQLGPDALVAEARAVWKAS
ncbi:MAG: RNA polymerase sigma factor [Pseudonocardiales bacterium]